MRVDSFNDQAAAEQAIETWTHDNADMAEAAWRRGLDAHDDGTLGHDAPIADMGGGMLSYTEDGHFSTTCVISRRKAEG